MAHLLHLIFCIQWLAFHSLQVIGAWTREEYLSFVAPYAPIVFAVGPWSIWSIKHLANRRAVRRRRMAEWAACSRNEGADQQ